MGSTDYHGLLEKKILTTDELERLTTGENKAIAGKYFVACLWASEVLKMLATGGHLVRAGGRAGRAGGCALLEGGG